LVVPFYFGIISYFDRGVYSINNNNSSGFYPFWILLVILYSVFLLKYIKPPASLAVNPLTSELKFQTESLSIMKNATIRLIRSSETRRVVYFEGGSTILYSLHWALIIRNGSAGEIILYILHRESIFKRFLIDSTKRFDGWLPEVADQLSRILNLDLTTNYDGEVISNEAWS